MKINCFFVCIFSLSLGFYSALLYAEDSDEKREKQSIQYDYSDAKKLAELMAKSMESDLPLHAHVRHESISFHNNHTEIIDVIGEDSWIGIKKPYSATVEEIVIHRQEKSLLWRYKKSVMYKRIGSMIIDLNVIWDGENGYMFSQQEKRGKRMVPQDLEILPSGLLPEIEKLGANGLGSLLESGDRFEVEELKHDGRRIIVLTQFDSDDVFKYWIDPAVNPIVPQRVIFLMGVAEGKSVPEMDIMIRNQVRRPDQSWLITEYAVNNMSSREQFKAVIDPISFEMKDKSFFEMKIPEDIEFIE
ncbi:hypothetical protein KS4_22070 [Poriferisphaera corsica]|uniref:Outer membrane lipoprotein-sorting protein n=2 Tax=Poriferisphaera corsica TaxID=2528020 RepID=A0A517YV91_9BACT|nr:hypothetical protein KS4_22070 [Poriferisphaera corsica]